MPCVLGLTRKQVAARVLIGLAALFLLIQLVPYGRDHSNPPVTRAAVWSDKGAEQLAIDSCYDCHSNLTRWRWYSNIAPVSWLVQKDVDEGRKALNFSEWDRPQANLAELESTVSEGEMPPVQYSLPRPSAKLSSAERIQLTDGLRLLYSQDPPGGFK